MVDFAKQTTTNYMRFYPVSPAAKKYIEKPNAAYERYYKPGENCIVFALPDDEANAGHCVRHLVEAGFYVQEVEAG